MKIVHDPKARRFETTVEGLACVCDYHLDARQREVTFTHTYVPDALRGRGVAAALVAEALAWSKQQQLRVVPACSYVRSYMQRHPQWLALMADENP